MTAGGLFRAVWPPAPVPILPRGADDSGARLVGLWTTLVCPQAHQRHGRILSVLAGSVGIRGTPWRTKGPFARAPPGWVVDNRRLGPGLSVLAGSVGTGGRRPPGREAEECGAGSRGRPVCEVGLRSRSVRSRCARPRSATASARGRRVRGRRSAGSVREAARERAGGFVKPPENGPLNVAAGVEQLVVEQRRIHGVRATERGRRSTPPENKAANEAAGMHAPAASFGVLVRGQAVKASRWAESHVAKSCRRGLSSRTFCGSRAPAK